MKLMLSALLTAGMVLAAGVSAYAGETLDRVMSKR